MFIKILTLLLCLGSVLHGTHLSQFPAPFVDLDARSPIQFELILPNEPSTSEIEAAMRLSAYFSKMMTFEAFDIPVKKGKVTSDKHQIVIFDKGTTIGRGTGYLSLQLSDEGFLRLLIEGNNAEGLDKAISLLENGQILKHLHLDTLAVHQYPPKSPHGDDVLSFAQLGKSPLIFSGLDKHKVHLTVYPPLREKLNPESYISLNYRHSILLDPQRSDLEVFINGIFAAATKLTEETAEKGTLKFKIPESELHKKEWNIDIVLQQKLQNGVEEDPLHAWTVIENHSSIHFLENDSLIKPNIDNFPGILNAGQALTDQMILTLPDDVSEATLTAALQIAALGAKNNLYPIRWKIIKGQDLSVNDQNAPFLIFLGTDKDVMEWKVLGMQLPSVKDWQAALVPLISPWRKDQVIYAIVTREETDCPLFLKKLFTSHTPLNIQNQMAVMDKDFKVETKYIKSAAVLDEKTSLENSTFYIIGLAALGLIALAYYLYQKK